MMLRDLHRLMMALIIAIGSVACIRDGNVPVAAVSLQILQVVELDTCATIIADVSSRYPVSELHVLYSTDRSFTSYDSVSARLSGRRLNVILSPLFPETRYYVRYRLSGTSGSMLLGEITTLLTDRTVLPPCEISLPNTEKVTSHSAVVESSIIVRDGAVIENSGVCYSQNPSPSIEYDMVLYSDNAGTAFSLSMHYLDPGTTYYVRPWVKWSMADGTSYVTYGAQLVFSTAQLTDEDEVFNDHAAVELGLMVKWATCNIGSSAPEEAGDYFAWGETSVKTSYTQDNYMVTGYGLLSDDRTVLGVSDDAATQLWGDGWRIPTEADYMELLKYCDCAFSSLNGVQGLLITSRITKKTMFIPSGGMYENASNEGLSYGYGYCWTSERAPSSSDEAYAFSFQLDNGRSVHYMPRTNGLPIRAVHE